jgi:hypothetical protein
MAGDIVRSVAFACAVVVAAQWVLAWRRGDERVRDRRGRLKPLPAAALALAIVVALGTVASFATT